MEASCHYGRGTRWCISGREENAFKSYAQNNSYFYFIINKNAEPRSPESKLAVQWVVGKAQPDAYFDADDNKLSKQAAAKLFPLKDALAVIKKRHKQQSNTDEYDLVHGTDPKRLLELANLNDKDIDARLKLNQNTPFEALLLIFKNDKLRKGPGSLRPLEDLVEHPKTPLKLAMEMMEDIFQVDPEYKDIRRLAVVIARRGPKAAREVLTRIAADPEKWGGPRGAVRAPNLVFRIIIDGDITFTMKDMKLDPKTVARLRELMKGKTYEEEFLERAASYPVSGAAARVLAGSAIDSLPDFNSVDELIDHIRRLPKADLMEMQEELNDLHKKAVAPYASMEVLFHGAPNKVIDAIRAEGFKLTKGQRTGLFGDTNLVHNQAIFLSEDEKLARSFGANRDPHEGRDSGVLEVRADIRKTLDMTKWQAVPKDLRKLAIDLITEYDGSNIRKPRQEDLFWLIDQPAFVDVVKKRYDSVRFSESRATKKHFGLEKTGGDTIAVFDPKKLHLMPLPQNGPKGLFNVLKERR
jgi:hypothetical protein